MKDARMGAVRAAIEAACARRGLPLVVCDRDSKPLEEGQEPPDFAVSFGKGPSDHQVTMLTAPHRSEGRLTQMNNLSAAIDAQGRLPMKTLAWIEMWADARAMLAQRDAALCKAGANREQGPAWSYWGRPVTRALLSWAKVDLQALPWQRDAAGWLARTSLSEMEGEIEIVLRGSRLILKNFHVMPNPPSEEGTIMYGEGDSPDQEPWLTLLSDAQMPATILEGIAGRDLSDFISLPGVPSPSGARIITAACEDSAIPDGVGEIHIKLDDARVPMADAPTGIRRDWLSL